MCRPPSSVVSMNMDLDDFGTIAAAARRRRRAVPTWVRGKAPSAGGRWIRLGARTYYAARRETLRTLPPGMYTLDRDHEGDVIFERRDLAVDALVRFAGSTTDLLLREVEGFWSLADAFAEHGFLHRRGYLLYGPAGCGKSSIVRQVIHHVVQQDGLVILCGAPGVLGRGLVALRRIEVVRPVVCVFEDIDAIVANHGEEELLSLLDGENQVDHVLNVATTNYPEQLDRRFVARPRRFDRIVRIDAADERTRRSYLTTKLPRTDAAELERWVRATEGLSLAALAEAVISVCCLGNGLEETIALLRKTSAGRVSSRDFSLAAGFAVPAKP